MHINNVLLYYCLIFFLLTECVDLRFGPGMFSKNINIIPKKCNQKCLDVTKRNKKKEETNLCTVNFLMYYPKCL